MSQIENLKQFKKDFLGLVETAVNSNVPLQNLILELETEKFRLQMILLRLQTDREARELHQKILTGHEIQIPITLNHNQSAN